MLDQLAQYYKEQAEVHRKKANRWLALIFILLFLMFIITII